MAEFICNVKRCHSRANPHRSGMVAEAAGNAIPKQSLNRALGQTRNVVLQEEKNCCKSRSALEPSDHDRRRESQP